MRVQALALLDPGDARDEGRWGILQVDVDLRSPRFTSAALLSELMKANLISGMMARMICVFAFSNIPFTLGTSPNLPV